MLFCNLVLALVGIMLKMTDIGYVTYIAHLVAEMGKIAEEYIKGDCRPRMTEVPVTIYGRTAHIHPDLAFMNRHKALLAACQRVIMVKSFSLIMTDRILRNYALKGFMSPPLVFLGILRSITPKVFS